MAIVLMNLNDLEQKVLENEIYFQIGNDEFGDADEDYMKAVETLYEKIIQSDKTALLKEACTFVETMVKEIGGCDHSVGLCSCADQALLDKLKEVLK